MTGGSVDRGHPARVRPIPQHDPLHLASFDPVLMNGGPVDVTMYHEPRATGREAGLDRLLRDINDGIGLALSTGLAFFPHPPRHLQSGIQRARKKRRDPARVADHLFEILVVGIVRAEFISVADHRLEACKRLDGPSRQQLRPCSATPSFAYQKVTIAADEGDRDPPRGQRCELTLNAGGRDARLIVTDPQFEQIAKNEKPPRLGAPYIEETAEPVEQVWPAIVEVQVRDEQGIHARYSTTFADRIITGSRGTSW